MVRDIKVKTKRMDTQARLGLRPRTPPSANVWPVTSLTTLTSVNIVETAGSYKHKKVENVYHLISLVVSDLLTSLLGHPVQTCILTMTCK